MARPPRVTMSSTTLCAALVSCPSPCTLAPTSLTTTAAPSSAIRRQMPPPMPPPPPVTNATLPSSLPMLAPRYFLFDRLKFRRVVHQQHLAAGILVEPLLDRLVVRELLLPMDILLSAAGTVVLARLELQRCGWLVVAHCAFGCV